MKIVWIGRKIVKYWLLTVLLMSSCNKGFQLNKTDFVEQTSTPMVTHAVPLINTATPTFALQESMAHTPTVKITVHTFTPSPNPLTSKITTIKRIAPGSSERLIITEAFWGNDEDRMIYLAQPLNQEAYQWYEYNVDAASSTMIPPFIPFDIAVWNDLQVPNPKQEGYDPITTGYVSPSGNYLLYPTYVHNSADSNKAETKIWISSKDGKNRKQLFDFNTYVSISKAIWIEDEQKVVFDITSHGGDIFITDVKKGSTINFTQLTGNEALSQGDWILSPIYNLIAIPMSDVANQERTNIYSLDGRLRYSFKEYSQSLSWTPDGENLCYWTRGVSTENNLLNLLPANKSLHCYSWKENKVYILLGGPDIEDLKKSMEFLYVYKPQVSNDMKKIILFNQDLWLVELK